MNPHSPQSSPPLTLGVRTRSALMHVMPHHALSWLMRVATRIRFRPWKDWQMRWFIRRYNVDMTLAEQPEPTRYSHFNEFFTRALTATARPICDGQGQVACPADGRVSALGAIGVNTASLLTSLGIAGLTIGFAARDALSNIISGILIFWDRPFVIGDLVDVSGEYGRVERITLRSTRIVTPDGRMLAVPNTEIINRTVASYTNFPHLRLDVGVTVGVREDLDKVRRILLSLVEEDARFMADPAPVAIVKQLNDYNVLVELRAWIHDERRHIELRCALREEVFRALTQAGVDMPFETFRLEPVTVRSSAA